MYEKILILEKAAEIFGEKGFFATTIEEIAVKAGIRKTTIYKYFKNKEELFLELLDTAEASLKREVFENIGLSEDLREKLSRFIISILRFARNQKNYYKIIHVGKNVEEGDIRSKQEAIRAEFSGNIYRLLQDGIRQGRFRTVNPLVATAFLCKLVEGTVEVIEAEPSFSADQMILSMLDMIWNGLAKKDENGRGM